LQLTIPGQDARSRLKIKLIFIENKIDRIGAEMN